MAHQVAKLANSSARLLFALAAASVGSNGSVAVLLGQQQARPAQANGHTNGTTALPVNPLIPQQPSAAVPLVLRGVTVIDVRDGQRLSAQTVVIVGNRIRSIGPADRVRVPQGARVISARGKYLIPGLWDMHVHPQHFVDLAYPLFVANGITGVRDAGSEVPLVTLGQWKQEIATGLRVGPRLIVSGPSINEAPPKQKGITHNEMGRHNILVPLALARYIVDSLRTAGADMLKPYNVSREMHLALAAEARRVGFPFGGHSWHVPGLELSDSGARLLDHNTWFNPNVCGEWSDQHSPAFDAAQCAAAGERLRRNGTWVVFNGPSCGGIDLEFVVQNYLELYRRYIPRTWFNKISPMIATLPHRPTLTSTAALASAVAAGDSAAARDSTEWLARQSGKFVSKFVLTHIPIVAATDVFYEPNQPSNIFASLAGFSLHRVLTCYVIDGMTPLEALRTATLNPALALGVADSLGTVEAGKLADLVLLDADPLADIWHTRQIRAVVTNGRYYDRAALDGLLAQVRRLAARR